MSQRFGSWIDQFSCSYDPSAGIQIYSFVLVLLRLFFYYLAHRFYIQMFRLHMKIKYMQPIMLGERCHFVERESSQKNREKKNLSCFYPPSVVPNTLWENEGIVIEYYIHNRCRGLTTAHQYSPPGPLARKYHTKVRT